MKAAKQYFPCLHLVKFLPDLESPSLKLSEVDTMVLWYFPLLRSFSTFINWDTLEVYLQPKRKANDWLTDWLTNRSIDWSIDWMIVWCKTNHNTIRAKYPMTIHSSPFVNFFNVPSTSSCTRWTAVYRFQKCLTKTTNFTKILWHYCLIVRIIKF